MLDVGRLCIKTAGKDAGKMVVVVDALDSNFVMIDGPVKRKRCNILHLEPTSKVMKLKKNAPHTEVVKEFKTLKIEIPEHKTKKQKASKPQKQRVKEGKPTPKTEVKKEVKKEAQEKKKTGKSGKK